MHWYQEAGNYLKLSDNPVGSHEIHGYSAGTMERARMIYRTQSGDGITNVSAGSKSLGWR